MWRRVWKGVWKGVKVVVQVVAVTVALGYIVLQFRRPEDDRGWIRQQEVLPHVTLTDTTARIEHVRDFRYASTDSFTVRYQDRTYDLRKIERVWYALSTFNTDWRGPAHTFLTFSFADSQFVSISVEARREAGEEFSTLHGALREFELMVVIGTEQDLIDLRAVTWNDPIYLYPGRGTPDQVRALFVALLRRAQELEAHPEFYNTFTNNCTTNLLDAVNTVRQEPIPYSLDVLLPGYSDEVAYENDLLDTDLPLEEARRRFLINERAMQATGTPDYSFRIRE
jgi:Domain of unknown function (DUF4105)